MPHETYWELLRDPAHWLLELTIMVLFDGLVLGVLWPFIRKHWRHHLQRDRRENLVELTTKEWEERPHFHVPQSPQPERRMWVN